MIKTSVFKIQIVCPGCNNYHAVSGIVDTDICRNCGKHLNVKGVLIDNMFGFMDREKYINGFLSGGIEQMGGAGAYKLEYSSMPPYCEECFAVIPYEAITGIIDSAKPYKCNACGHKMPVRKADSALKEFHPKAIGVINDSSGSDSGKAEQDKDSLLVYKCSTCGAALELSDDTKRTIECRYCDNENYLPDAIWTKLHPNREVQPLFVVMDLSDKDLADSTDYFLNVTPLSIYRKHFENFIRSYFEAPFESPAFLSWLKSFVSAVNNEKVSFNMDVTKIQKFFYDNLKLGLSSHLASVKEIAAEYGLGIPPDLQLLMAEDGNESVRLALSKNKDLSKAALQKLKQDTSEAVRAEAAKHKSGFFGRLFG